MYRPFKNKITHIALPAIILLVIASAFYTPVQAPNTLSEDEKKQGWELLFDGHSKKGWQGYAPNGGGQWEIQDEALHANTSLPGPGDIVTDKEYDNFDLKLDWKISKNGNSGIIFYVHQDFAKYPESYETGLEMQVLDNDGHPDGKIHKHRAGDLYDLIASSSEPVKPVGEWNQAEIWCKNGELKLYLNGVNVVSTTLWDDNWKQLVAGSKFKQMPGFGTFHKGKIDLQDHGNEVWFRNIKIKKL
jgi:hypothetical protein